jgi:RNA polymerase sigma-70 factor (ECF subfamily)
MSTRSTKEAVPAVARTDDVTQKGTGPLGANPGEMLLRAFNELRDELLSTLLFLLGNREDAQDAAQETFVKCWRTQESLLAVENLRAWIFRVALNTAKDMQRSAWRRRARPLIEGVVMHASQTDLPEQEVEHKETLERLRRAILTLRHEEQEVFLLRQNGELTYEQIAEIRRLPVGTVKTQMRAALQKLRAALV